MKSKCGNYNVGDVLIIYDSGGYYSTHPARWKLKYLKRSNENFNTKLDPDWIWEDEPDQFPLRKKVTIIGFQSLHIDEPCLIVRYKRKAYWISINSLRRGGSKIVDKTNPRRTRDILKRYWE